MGRRFIFAISFSFLWLNGLADHLLQSPGQIVKATLGKGYDAFEERFKGECLTGDIEFVGSEEANIRFDRSLSYEELADSLGFNFGAKARYGAINSSLAAQFASSSSGKNYSETTIYQAIYKFKNVKFRYNSLSQVGKIASEEDLGSGGNKWERTCGNEFVEQIELGARIYISAEIEFANKEDKQNFAADFKIKGPAFSAGATLKKASERFGKSAAIYIRAYQQGGDVRKLSSIFQNKSVKTTKDKAAIHALLVCSMEKIDSCIEVFDNALHYAADTQDIDAFPNQIKDIYNRDSSIGPAQLSYITKSYEDLAIYQKAKIIEDIILAARKDLARYFDAAIKQKNRLEVMLNGPFRLSKEQQTKTENLLNVLQNNVQKIYESAMKCYQSEKDCALAVSKLQNNLDVVDEANLEIMPEEFAQWCDALSNKILNKEERKIVEILYSLVFDSDDLADQESRDNCSLAQNKLNSFKELDLSGHDLQNIEPISSLHNLQVLNLNRNRIKDIHPLAKLINLEALYLNKNKIRNISPIYELTKLRILHLAENNISFIDGFNFPELLVLNLFSNNLNGLSFFVPKLININLGHNKLKNIECLENIKSIKKVDLSYNDILDFSLLERLPSLEDLRLHHNPGKCPVTLMGKCAALDL